MAKAKDPFIFGRIEHEHGTLLYMPDDICDWVSRKPQIFEGLRGSGKSSILKSLSWEVAWGISDFKLKTSGSKKVKQVTENPSHIGVYHRVEDMDIALWDRWSVGHGREHAQQCFGTYLDYLYLDLFLNALHEIQKLRGTLLADSKAERHLVQDLLQRCFPTEFRPHLPEPSFRSLRSTAIDTHSGIRGLVCRDVPSSEILETYPIAGPGDVIQAFGGAFIKYYPELNEWTLMPLLDDCNLLPVWQAVVLNTAVVKARKPIAYKLTSVRGFYPSRETLDSVRTIAEHDVGTVYVPSVSPTDKSFQKLAEGICRAKIERHYSVEVAERFSFKRALGSFDIEALLVDKLKTLEKQRAHELLKLAKARSKSRKAISITEAWLFQNRVRELAPIEHKDPTIARLQKRRMESKYLKKWRYSAGIALCKELRIIFPYSGWEVVLHLSCGSIRELLRIMSMIWRVAGLEIDDFVEEAPVKASIQTRAIIRSAQAMYQAIDKKPLYRHTTLPDICDRLGELFSKCQSSPFLLTIAETASVKFKVSELGQETLLHRGPKEVPLDVMEVISRAVMAGVMLKNEDKGFLSLGLHPILSPKYKICFRSPFYYPEGVSGRQVIELFTRDSARASGVIKKILSRRLERYRARHKKNQLGFFNGEKGL